MAKCKALKNKKNGFIQDTAMVANSASREKMSFFMWEADINSLFIYRNGYETVLFTIDCNCPHTKSISVHLEGILTNSAHCSLTKQAGYIIVYLKATYDTTVESAFECTLKNTCRLKMMTGSPLLISIILYC